MNIDPCGMKKVYRVTLPNDWEASNVLYETRELAVDSIRANVCDSEDSDMREGDEFTISVELISEAEWAAYLALPEQ